jgi:hypothetical protein
VVLPLELVARGGGLTSWGRLAAAGGAGLLLFGVLAWVMVLDREDRARVRALAARARAGA